MTLCPVLAPSWVTIDLDTTPPLLAFDAPARVEPPDEWLVIVRANEDLGPVGMTFTDTYGTVTSIGFERVGPRTLAVRVPTVGLSSGAGELKVVARDRACNATTAVQTVVLLRPRAFDVTMTIDSGITGGMTMDTAFEVTSEIGSGFDVQQTLDHAFEVESEIEPALDTTMEIT